MNIATKLIALSIFYFINARGIQIYFFSLQIFLLWCSFLNYVLKLYKWKWPFHKVWRFLSTLLKHKCCHREVRSPWQVFSLNCQILVMVSSVACRLLLLNTTSQVFNSSQFYFWRTVTVFIWLFKAKVIFLGVTSWTLLGNVQCVVCLLSTPEHCRWCVLSMLSDLLVPGTV